MKTVHLNKRKVTTNIFLRTVLIAKTAYLAFGIALGRVLLFAENEILLTIFASIFSIFYVTCAVLLIRSCNHFLGYGSDENQTEHWYSKPKALAEELLFPTHMLRFVKQGCPKTEVLRFFQPYEIVYDREGEVVTGINTFWHNYNRSLVFWLTGVDYPSEKWA